MPYCPKCGSKIDAGDVFCTECGFKMGGGSSNGVATQAQIISAVEQACKSVCGSSGSLSGDIDLRAYYDVYISGSTIFVHANFSVQRYCMLSKAKKLAAEAISNKLPRIKREINMALSSLTLPMPYDVKLTSSEPSIY